MAGISRDVLLGEVKSAEWILSKWLERLTAGIPGVTAQETSTSAGREVIDQEFLMFITELALVSRKCEMLVDLLSRQ